MVLFTLEHGKTAYRADFVFYGAAICALAGALAASPVQGPWWGTLSWVLFGLLSWSAMEYGLHRFVLHGVQPFQRWHALHHARPTALIATPTALTATAFAALVFAPAWALSSWQTASAWTLGVLMGYLAYALTHHATHHWRSESVWLLQRKRHHALHHHHAHGGFYGVTSNVWDVALGTHHPKPGNRVANG
jgi:cyclopropane-fatty-acyl-phospholipid synthase